MRPIRRLKNRILGALTGHRRERELARELEAHIEMQTEDNLRLGMSPEEARRAAMLKFGGIESAKESYREQRGVPQFEILVQDLRYAFRGMRRNPGFTAVIVACLALGIGANTAIFSLINAVMIRSLPVKNPEQLVLLRYVAPTGVSRQLRRVSSGHGSTSLPLATFEQLRGHNQVLSNVFAFVPLGFNNQSVTVGIGGQTSLAGGEMVSGDYFSALGVSPILGRAIQQEDEQPSAPQAVVISYNYWSRQFDREASVIGRSIALNGVPFTIVGVTPPEFYGVDPTLVPDLWVPLRDQRGITPWGVQHGPRQSMFADKGWWWLMIMGRVRPGLTEQQAQAELDTLFRNGITYGVNPPPDPKYVPHLGLLPAGKGLDFLRQQFSKPLYILVTAVGLVLLITCANVATLLLARATARHREMSVRLSTGASRARLIRQLLTESVVLAASGGVLGVLFAEWGSKALLLLMLGSGQPIPFDVRPDATVLGFTAAVAMVTGVLFGFAPAFRATRVDLASTLKENAGAVSPRLGLGKVLIAVQVALSLLLLIGAGLFVRTLQNLENQELGFNQRNLLLFALDPRRSGYTNDRIASTFRQTLQNIQATPGVRSVTASQLALLSGWINNSDASTDGPEIRPGEARSLYWNGVGPAFFETMGIPFLLGRGIDWRDVEGSHKVAVVNEAMARHFFPGENSLGHHFHFGGKRDSAIDYEIVGVVQNAKYDRLREEPPATAYLPYTSASDTLGRMYFEVRTAGDPAAMTTTIRQIVRGIDASLPLIDVKTQTQMVEEGLIKERMFAQLSTCFGVLALLLVSVGLYGTLAYAVARRTSEIGIRMALGAQRSHLLWMVLRESLALIVVGVVIGLPVALATTRFVAGQLYGVKANDAATIAATVFILVAVGAAAGYLPAHRASRVDPMVALRCE